MKFLIFGGRSPIALSLCKQLTQSGHEVHLATRNRDSKIIEIAADLKVAVVHECDLQDSPGSIALATQIDETVGGLDGLAFLHRYRVQESNPLDQYELEVLNPYRILDAFSKRSRHSQLAVVLTTSPASDSVVKDQDFFYHATKAGVAQLVRYGSVNFAGSNMRVNGINPGSFVYKERAADFYKQNPAVIESVKQSVPLGRMAKVEEIASVASFLLSESSSYINGEIINIDGGISNLAV